MKPTHQLPKLLASVLALSMLASFATGCRKDEPVDEGTSSVESTSSQTEIDLSANLKVQKPNDTIIKNYEEALAINEDAVGWLTVPNTSIDAPVLQGENNTKHERLNLQGEYDFNGSYWVDYEGTLGDRTTISNNTIIYGHSMDDNANGTHFSQLKKYLDFDFAKENPYITFSTKDDEMVWEVFSVMYCDIFLDYLRPDIKGADYEKMLGEMRERSQYIYDVDVDINDKILVLSTCTYPTNFAQENIDKQHRFVICARLVTGNEELKETASLKTNPNPKPPEYYENYKVNG